MAKGNMFQGQATGKIGDVVFMVRNGQQISRVYTSAGGRSGDQASIAVRRQRVRFGAASNQYLLYRNIVRGMYRTGKATKQSDYNFFVRENIDLLPYLTKDENAAGVKCAMPGTFSRGTLGQLPVQIMVEELGESQYLYSLMGSNLFPTAVIANENTVAELKALLKVAFPNARKVSFAICSVLVEELDLPNGSQFTHTFLRDDLIFDLYEADPNVADSALIKAYIDQYVTNELVLKAAASGDLTFLDRYSLMQIAAELNDDYLAMNKLYIIPFATNDQVGDCYATTLTNMVVPESDGGLSLYESLRTDNHRQVAEDSYGYATGVMRTNIQQA